MQGNFYGAFQGKKRDILPLLSKLGMDRGNQGTITGIIFDQVELPENWPELDDETWVKLQFSSGGSMRINYLEGGLFTDLGAYMLHVEGFTCTFAMDYGNARTYTYSPYGSLEVLTDLRRKQEAQSAAKEFEKTTGQTSVTRDQQDWDDYYQGNADKFIPKQLLPPEQASAGEEEAFLIKNGVLMLYQGSKAEEVVIPKGCKEIGPRAFQNHQELKKVSIPSTVKIIREDAFRGCEALAEVEFSKGLKEIEALAFCDTALEKPYLPDGLTKLGIGAVMGAPRIPASLKDLGEKVGFIDGLYEGWTGIEVPEDHPVYACKDGVLYQKKDGLLLKCFRDIQGPFEVPAGVKKIGQKAFWLLRELSSVRIPEGVTEIGNDAFGGCWNLESVELPQGLTKIGSSAFSVCRALTSVQLPDSLKELGWSAFHDCSNLKMLELPDGLESTDFSFTDKAIVLAGDLSVPLLRKAFDAGRPVEIRVTPERDYSGMVTARLLGYFIDRDDLESLLLLEKFAPEDWLWQRLPDLLHHAQHRGAARVEAHLRQLDQAGLEAGKKHKPPTVAMLKKMWKVKDQKDGTCSLEEYRGEDFYVTMPAAVGKLVVTKCGRLSGSKIVSLTLPASLTTIADSWGSDSLFKLENLESIQVEQGSETFVAENGVLFKKGGKTLLDCPAKWPGERYQVPKGVVKIGEGAFANNQTLTEIQLPAGLKTIESGAFRGCRRLARLEIPEGVKELPYDTFAKCASLKDVFLPASLTEINDYAFSRTWGVVIHAPAGSYAKQFAEEKEMEFQQI